MIRCYSELMRIKTFKERFEYLKLSGSVGEKTFGYDRWINQIFYNSSEWRSFRNKIIIRDNGCDLGIEGHEILGKGMLLIHHMNPISKQQILRRDPSILDPEFVITVSKYPTHEAIHYGDESLIAECIFAERSPGDTCLWG